MGWGEVGSHGVGWAKGGLCGAVRVGCLGMEGMAFGLVLRPFSFCIPLRPLPCQKAFCRKHVLGGFYGATIGVY